MQDLLPEAVLTISTLCRFIKAFDFTGSYKTRTPSIQGGFQAAGIVVSLLMAFAGGTLVGKQRGGMERQERAAEMETSTCFSALAGWVLATCVARDKP